MADEQDPWPGDTGTDVPLTAEESAFLREQQAAWRGEEPLTAEEAEASSRSQEWLKNDERPANVVAFEELAKSLTSRRDTAFNELAQEVGQRKVERQQGAQMANPPSWRLWDTTPSTKVGKYAKTAAASAWHGWTSVVDSMTRDVMAMSMANPVMPGQQRYISPAAMKAMREHSVEFAHQTERLWAEVVPVPEGMEDSLTSALGHAVGSHAGFASATALGIPIAVFGSAHGLTAGYWDAASYTEDDYKRWLSALGGAGLGLTEAWTLNKQVARMFSRWDKNGDFKRALMKTATTSLGEGVEEWGQETFQGLGQNFIAIQLGDGDRELMDDVIRGGQAGFLSGLFISMLTSGPGLARTHREAGELRDFEAQVAKAMAEFEAEQADYDARRGELSPFAVQALQNMGEDPSDYQEVVTDEGGEDGTTKWDNVIELEDGTRVISDQHMQLTSEEIAGELEGIEDQALRNIVGTLRKKKGYTGRIRVVDAAEVEGGTELLERAQRSGAQIDFIVGDGPLGVRATYHGNRIIIDARAGPGVAQKALFAHEAGHHIAKHQGVEAWIKGLPKHIVEQAGRDYNDLREQNNMPLLEGAALADEAQAYLAQNLPELIFKTFEDPQAVQDLATRQPGLFRSILEWFLEKLSKIGLAADPRAKQLEALLGKDHTDLPEGMSVRQAAEAALAFKEAWDALEGQESGLQPLTVGDLSPDAGKPVVEAVRPATRPSIKTALSVSDNPFDAGTPEHKAWGKLHAALQAGGYRGVESMLGTMQKNARNNAYPDSGALLTGGERFQSDLDAAVAVLAGAAAKPEAEVTAPSQRVSDAELEARYPDGKPARPETENETLSRVGQELRETGEPEAARAMEAGVPKRGAPRKGRRRRTDPTRAESAAEDYLAGEEEKFALAPPPDSAAFKRWFGDSKVVDADGKPLVVYHGTSSPGFTAFRRGTDDGHYGDGIYFSANREEASEWAGVGNMGGMPGAVMPVYLSIQNPAPAELAAELEMTHHTNTSKVLAGMGYDGVVSNESGAFAEVVAFSPTQIKSATGNTGTYSATDPDIRHALARREQQVGLVPPDPITSFPSKSDRLLTRSGAVLEDYFEAKAQAGNKFTDPDTAEEAALLEEHKRLRQAAMDAAGGVEFTEEDMARLGAMDRADPLPRFALSPPPSSAAFKRWFKQSKVVDADGKPLVVYHGSTGGNWSAKTRSTTGFTTFRKGRAGFGNGIFFSANSEFVTRDFVEAGEQDQLVQGHHTFPVYLSIQNPMVLDVDLRDEYSADEIADIFGMSDTPQLPPAYVGSGIEKMEVWEWAMEIDGIDQILRDEGFDGVVAAEGGDPVYIALHPTQIKSATGNRGTYSPTDPDIRHALAPEHREFWMGHRPNNEGAPAHDLLATGSAPDDIYDHPEYYTGDARSKSSRQSIAALRKARGNPDAEVTIYRASPSPDFHPGDWVSLSLQYAREHGMAEDAKDDLPVHSKAVKAKDVLWAGDDLNEFGYYPTDPDIRHALAPKTDGRYEVPYYRTGESATDMFGVPDTEAPFDRGFEPSGEYFTPLDAPLTEVREGTETGTHRFARPLVLPLGSYGKPSGWKRVLSARYGGLVGRDLSRAIVADGFDAILTTGEGGSLSEGVNLQTFDYDQARFALAHQGTGAEHFDKHDNKYIGSGEGNAAFGWGHYFTTKRGIAEHYKRQEGRKRAGGEMYAYTIGGEKVSADDGASDAMLDIIIQKQDRGAALAYHQERLKALAVGGWVAEADNANRDKVLHGKAAQVRIHRRRIKQIEGFPAGEVRRYEPGHVMRVDLAPSEDEYLRWDLPLSEQSEKVREAVEALWVTRGPTQRQVNAAQLPPSVSRSGPMDALRAQPVSEWTGEDIVYHLERGEFGERSTRTKRAASEALLAAGIRGNKYPAEGGKSDGEFNYVIFDPADITIEERFALKGRKLQVVKQGRRYAIMLNGKVVSVHPNRVVAEKRAKVLSSGKPIVPLVDDELEKLIAQAGHVMSGERGERKVVKPESVKLTPYERSVLVSASKGTGLKLRDLVAYVRAEKARHPASDGWAPLTIHKGKKLKKGVLGPWPAPSVGWKMPGPPKDNPDGDPAEPTPENVIVWATQGYTYHHAKGKESMPRAGKVRDRMIRVLATRMTKHVRGVADRARAGDQDALVILRQRAWYSNVVTRLYDEFGGSAEIFVDMLGALSPNTPVPTNFAFAMDAIHNFSDGMYDDALDQWQAHIEAGGNKLNYKGERALQKSGKKYGINTATVMNAMLVARWRLAGKGSAPKAKNFSWNLAGWSTDATIDVWAARFVQRLAGLRRIPVKAEKGVGGLWTDKGTVGGEFGFAQEVFETAAAEMGMNASDLQALVWFSEKQHWTVNDWTSKTGEDGSFEEQLDALQMDRRFAGIGTERPDAPQTPERASIIERVLRTLRGDPNVVVYRAPVTLGLFRGAVDPSFDMELTVHRGWDSAPWLEALFQVAEEMDQDAFFTGRVLRADEDGEGSAPGIEIRFAEPVGLAEAQRLNDIVLAAGFGGAHLMRDNRRMAPADAQESLREAEEYIGMRVIWIKQWAGKGETGLSAIDRLQDLQESLGREIIVQETARRDFDLNVYTNTSDGGSDYGHGSTRSEKRAGAAAGAESRSPDDQGLQAADRSGGSAGRVGVRPDGDGSDQGQRHALSGKPRRRLKKPGATAPPVTTTEPDEPEPVKVGSVKGVWPGVKKIAQKWFTSEGDLPTAAFDAMIRRDGRVNVVNQEIKEATLDFRRALKKVYKTLDITAEQNRSIDAAFKNPALIDSLPEPLRDPVRAFRTGVDHLSQLMIDLGVVEGDLAMHIGDNMGVYATRSYRVFDDPKWAEQVSVQVRNRAKALIREQYPDKTEDEVEAYIEHLLYQGKAAQSPMRLLSGSKLGAKDLSILIRRKDISPEIRALFGEYENPLVNYTRSISKMSHMIANHQLLQEVRVAGLAGEWLSDVPRGDNIVQIAAEASSVMEPLNGLFTTPEILQAFEDATSPAQSGDLMRIYMKANGVVKLGKTVISLMTHARNVVGNVGFAVAQGHWDVRKFREAMDILHAMSSDERRAYLKDALKHGVIHESARAGELADVIQDAIGKTPEGVALSHMGKVSGPAAKALQGVMNLYQKEDDFWKIYAWENEKRRYRKAHPEWSEAQLKAHTAQIVRNTYPTYSLVPRVVKLFRRSPLIGTFVSFPAEVVRTSYQTIRLIETERKDPATRAIGAQRLAGAFLAATGAAGMALASRILLGIGDDEDEAMREFYPPWSRNSDIVHMGGGQWVDLGYTDPHSYLKGPLKAFMRGEDWESSITDMLQELLEPFFGSEILGSAIAEIWANSTETGRPVYNEAQTWDKIGWDMTEHLAKAFEPGIISSARRIKLGLEGHVTTYGKEYDPWVESIAVVSGTRINQLDVEQAMMFRARDYSRQVSQATRILSSAASRAGNVPDSEIESAYDEMEASRLRAHTELVRVANAARTLGMSNTVLYDRLRAAGLSKEKVYSILRDSYKPYEPSSSFLRSYESGANEERKAALAHRRRVVHRLYDER